MTVRTPQNLEELRHLYIRIRNNEHAIKLTGRSLDVLGSMLNVPNETATKSISEIALENDINISSVTRLAQKLGFDGFSDLKKIFRSSLRQHKSFYSEQVKKFLHKRNTGQNEKMSILERVIQDEWSNVMVMADTFDDKRLANIIKLMENAGRIFIIGLRSSYPLAHYLSFYLKMIRDNVILTGRAGHTMAEDLSVLKSGDLLIAISINPYTKETVKVCQYAKQKSIDIITITDSLSSPLVMGTDNLLLVSSEGDYFFTPMIAAMICIETLLSEQVKHLGDKAIQRLTQTEYAIEKLGIEI